ncbi:hypothetical protein PHMEG_00018378 [Phytophthora megakarya]|uniref:Reverse transcriptase n=1 Tax=Phytophthora megakarya TaxID=4795 RepID=A0A225VUH6_9STRA|nr:hypothetical protein PHMEG_00018378 [Phytophthora megakarya]
MLGPKPSSVPERSAYEWRRKLQREYSYALACNEDLQKKAKKMRSDEQTRKWLELPEWVKAGFEKGDSVWLYIPRVQTGLSRKLARMWHGPFRIDEIRDDFRVRRKVKDAGSRPAQAERVFQKRPTVEVDVTDDDDFDAALLHEDSWEPDNSNDVFEVESIQGYDNPEWIPVAQLKLWITIV